MFTVILSTSDFLSDLRGPYDSMDDVWDYEKDCDMLSCSDARNVRPPFFVFCVVNVLENDIVLFTVDTSKY